MAQENWEKQNEGYNALAYDPSILVRNVLKRWYVILLAALLAGMLAFVYVDQTYEPVYTTTTTFVVSSRNNSSSAFQNLQATSNLAATFSQVLNSSLLKNKVVEELGMSAFSGNIQTNVAEGTNLITMNVSGPDPRTTFLVTKSVLENHATVSQQVLGDIVLEVLQDPVVPMRPSNPLTTGHITKKAGIMGAAAACLLLLLLAYLRDTVRSKQEAEKKLAEPVIGQLHHEIKDKKYQLRLGKRPKTSILITNPTTSFTYVEEIRKLRHQIERRMPQGGKVLLITSMLENEGKSTTAANIALSLAQKQYKVLLVDFDLRRPSCYKVLNQQPSTVGVSDVLNGRAKLDSTVVAFSQQKQLDLLMEYQAHYVSEELFSSEKTKKMLDLARQTYDYIVLDTAPMSAAPDAECLAEMVDASILVVRQDMACAQILNNALDVLHRAPSKLLGCVLNDVQMPILTEFTLFNGGYGYGGYSRYGRYEQYGRYGRYGAYVHTHSERDKVGSKHE